MSLRRRVQQAGVIAFAALLLAFNYNIFVFSNRFAPSGLSGIATIVQELFGFKIAYMTILVNVPLSIVIYRLVDHEFALKSALFTVFLSLGLTLFENIDLSALVYHTENGTSTILAPIAGGVVAGFCYGIVMKRNACTGGIDLIAAWVHHYHPERSMVWVIFTINAVIATASYFVYDFRIEPVILCLIYSFATSKVCDVMLKGFKEAVKFEIVTDRPEELAKAIMETTHHGVTELPAVGSFTHNNKTLLICVVNKHQIVPLQRTLEQFPGSFAYLSSVKETMGNFRQIK